MNFWKLKFWFKNPKNVLIITQTFSFLCFITSGSFVYLAIEANNQGNKTFGFHPEPLNNADAIVHFEATATDSQGQKVELFKHQDPTGHWTDTIDLPSNLGLTVYDTMAHDPSFISHFDLKYSGQELGYYIKNISDWNGKWWDLGSKQYWQIFDFNNPKQAPAPTHAALVGISSLGIVEKDTWIVFQVSSF